MLKLYFDSGNKELILQLAKENDFMISAASFVDQTPSSYAIRSVGPSVIIYFTKSEFDLLLHRFPEMHFHFSSIIQRMSISLEQRSSLLMLSPKERWNKMHKSGHWVTGHKRVTDRILAAYLGVKANAVCAWRKIEQKRT